MRALLTALACGVAAAAPAATPAAATAAASPGPAAPPLLQSWSDPALIASDDDWSNVPGIAGHRGDGLTSEPGVDPRAVLADGSGTPLDVNANRTDPRAVGLAAGVTEFELADPVVAIQGSATASAPHLVIALDTRGRRELSVRMRLRDVDASGADALSPVAVQYRVGAGAPFTNAPGGYVADATTGPAEATLTTPLRTTLPADAEGHPHVQVRVITANAAGEDEWVGIDDIEVTAAGAPGAATCPPPAPAPAPAPTPAPAPAPTGPPAPELTGLILSPDVFRPMRRGTALVRRGGASLRFRLSRAALVRFSVFRAAATPDAHTHARKPFGGGAGAPAWSLTRTRRDADGGRFSARAKRGLNRLRFSGRLRGRPLASGTYILQAVAHDRAGRASQPAAVRFQIGGD